MSVFGFVIYQNTKVHAKHSIWEKQTTLRVFVAFFFNTHGKHLYGEIEQQY